MNQAFTFGIITASDKGAKGAREDLSGPALAALLQPFGLVKEQIIVPDERPMLAKTMRAMAQKGYSCVFTTGGTGLGPRDVTPEATLDVVEKLVPGIGEAMRLETTKITPRAMLSRGLAGILGRTLIINLPGSPKAVGECFAVIAPVLEHALETLAGEGTECART